MGASKNLEKSDWIPAFAGMTKKIQPAYTHNSCCTLTQCHAAMGSSALTLRDSLSALPDSAQVFIDVLGDVELALTLLHVFGGQTVRLPASDRRYFKQHGKQAHPFAAYCNTEQMARLIQHYGGTELYLPRCHLALHRARNALIIDIFSTCTARGEASVPVVRRIAGESRLSDRMIWRILKKTE